MSKPAVKTDNPSRQELLDRIKMLEKLLKEKDAIIQQKDKEIANLRKEKTKPASSKIDRDAELAIYMQLQEEKAR